ncbi:bifunctional (p)ppGpp synthetase/guanosine-3',5'-bis(diphosphate) 3'-pyrophosphohydrolase [Candidatus Poribacteria bacterium]|nr:bifunctional (p)ppGpp synthetase/guanosine-3',5'-bis(diphosphate) 3'-pyrophosphohydrolase [Candidatus Poribacteria bacterium]
MEARLDTLLSDMREHLAAIGPDEVDAVAKAFDFAQRAHVGQLRRSGCPYFVHPFEVARILVDLRMDSPAICGGLLHDVVEDCGVTVEELEKEFGPIVAHVVDGVTKLGRIEYLRLDEHQSENYRKMVLAMARDVRVVIVKLADRLHNMQTIDYMSDAQRRRTAQETLEIYAPLAHRLGIARVRTELDDLAFKCLFPEAYKDIAQRVHDKRRERESYTQEMVDRIQAILRDGNVAARVFGRPKHLYSIYRKITVRGVPFDHIYDLIGFRVLVDTPADCWLALGIIHGHWVHMPDRFKDYLTVPKTNMYQSLHTTIMDGGRPAEVQIRTHDMHRIAELGVAAHWGYKDGDRPSSRSIDRFAWLRGLVEQIQEVRNPQEFIQSMRGELFEEEIFVFTPKGQMKIFRKGATPIDFAFAIHSDVGLHTSAAKVHGSIVPLKQELSSGDQVEILTSPDAHPSRDWLKYVKTSRARTKINHWLRAQEFEQSVQLGRRLIEAELRSHRRNPRALLKPAVLSDLATRLNHKTVEEFLADVGNGQISPQRVYHTLVPPEERQEEAVEPAKRHRQMVDARLDGISEAETRIAKCCQPIPGDDVVGYVTRGRGVTIHALDCPRIAGEFQRIQPIEWSSTGKGTYRTAIVLESNDRVALLRDVAEVIAASGANIFNAKVTTPDEFTAVHEFSLDVTSRDQLDKIVAALARVRGVRKVSRRHQG